MRHPVSPGTKSFTMKSRKKIIAAITIIAAIYIAYAAWPRLIPTEILQVPNDLLTSVSEEVKIFDEEIQGISEVMQTTLEIADFRGHIFGLGLAAPQIGYGQRIIALKNSYGDYQIMINPKIIEQKWLVPWTEKCLSLNGRHFLKRYFWTRVQYQDIEGSDHEEIIIGPKAAILQQEIDHLNGILISDY